MQTKPLSQTALRVACHRAAHQVLEGGSIFFDPYACKLLGDEAGSFVASAAANRSSQPMRMMFAARSRFAEDCLHEAVARGVRQIVLLGAGLDTFALRNPYGPDGVRLFELDHPNTQEWKLARIHDAGLEAPEATQFVPIDFRHKAVADVLANTDYASNLPTFFHWLGVVMYLPHSAVLETLGFVARVPKGEIVFDYTEPLENYAPARRAVVEAVAAQAKQSGEPWITFFDPRDLSEELARLGFDELEDVGFSGLRAKYIGAQDGDWRSDAGPHIMRARSR